MIRPVVVGYCVIGKVAATGSLRAQRIHSRNTTPSINGYSEVSHAPTMRARDRALLFWTVCIPLRLTLARYPPPRVVALLIGGRWLTGAEVTHEGFFGGEAFWADERPIHGALWTAFAVSGDQRFLLADAAFGAVNWVKG